MLPFPPACLTAAVTPSLGTTGSSRFTPDSGFAGMLKGRHLGMALSYVPDKTKPMQPVMRVIPHNKPKASGM
ncbi:hypothetical protein [Belnapia sp. F-4-1]|uniref:hypothetical protein n=1 Tax=Belnapia sp. F-4-1 TaxID=1545443 RepID=UPI001185537F|nr:hypothetical protein [Belnapia sp. F-4-1]